MARPVTHVTVRNGLTLAYVVALINAALAIVVAFGLTITAPEQAAITGFLNAAVLLAARVLNLPEKIPGGAIVGVGHVPVLSEVTPAPVDAIPPVAPPGVPIVTSVTPAAVTETAGNPAPPVAAGEAPA